MKFNYNFKSEMALHVINFVHSCGWVEFLTAFGGKDYGEVCGNDESRMQKGHTYEELI